MGLAITMELTCLPCEPKVETELNVSALLMVSSKVEADSQHYWICSALQEKALCAPQKAAASA